MTEYQYYVLEYMGRKDPFTFKSYTAWSSKEVAEKAANDYHSVRDGWECDWPLTFCVYFEGEWHTHKVDVEPVPWFRVVG